MLLETLVVDRAEFESRTNWKFKPEGVCKGDLCVPFPFAVGDKLDIEKIADLLHMPLVRDEECGLYGLGPESGGHALTQAQAPDLTLPDVNGNDFRLSSLRGKKVLLIAWASW